MRSFIRRTTTLALLGALAVGSGLPAAAQSGQLESLSHRQSILTELSNTGEAGTSRVFTQLKATGSGEVAVTLPNQSTRGLRNLEGFGKPDVNGDDVVWTLDASEDGFARSVADNTAELPVSVSVVYRLDGAEVSPSDLAGRTGQVEVEYTVRNLTAEPRDVISFDAENNKFTETMDVAVPMVGSLSLTLPASFANIDAPGGVTVGDGRGNTVINYSLLLFSPLGSEEQTVTWSAHAVDTAIPETSLQVLPVDDRSFGSLNATAEAYKGATESLSTLGNGALIINSNLLLLGSGASQLLDGLGQLADGAGQLNDGLANTAAPGARQLSDGMSAARAGGGQLATGLGELALGATRLSTGLGDARAGGSRLASGLGDLAIGATRLSGGLGAAEAGGIKLSNGLSQLAAGSDGLLAGLGTLKTSVTGRAGLPTAVAGVDQLRAGVLLAIAGIGSASAPDTLLNGVFRIGAGLSNPGCDVTDPQDPENPCGLLQVTGLLAAGAGQVQAGLSNPACDLTDPRDPENPCGLLQVTSLLTAGAGQLEAGLSNPACALNDPRNPNNPCGVLQSLSLLKAGVDGTGQYIAGSTATATGLANTLDSIDATPLTAVEQGRLAAVITSLRSPAAEGSLAGLLAGASGTNAAVDGGLDGLIEGVGDAETPRTLLYGVDQIQTGLAGITAGIGDAETARTLLYGLDQIQTGLAGITAGVGSTTTDGTLLNGIARLTLGLSNPGCDPEAEEGPTRCGLRDGLLRIAAGLSNPNCDPEDDDNPCGLREGLQGAIANINAGLGTTSDGPTESLIGGAFALRNGAAEASTGSRDLVAGLGELADGGGQLAAGAGTAASGSRDLVSGLGQLDDGAGQLAAGAGTAASGSRDLASGLVQLDDGASQLANGLGDAADGSGQLAEGLDSAEEGGEQIANGVGALQEGFEEQLIGGVSAGRQSASQDHEQIKAVIARGREGAAPYGTADGADATTVFQFDLAGVGTEEGPSTLLMVVLALAALGAAAGLGLALRQRLTA